MSTLELVAALLGVANVVLLIRRSIWNYPFAMAMVTLYAGVFWRERLYSDALLQLFFLAVNGWGWVLWARNRQAAGTIVVRGLSARDGLAWAAGGLTVLALWGGLEARFTDAAYPWADAGIAIGSVIAQLLLAKRYVENWPLWVAVDTVSIPLYAWKGLYATMILYMLLLALAAWGWIAWRRVARVQAAA